MSPARCSKCLKCGSDLATSPSLHGEPSPHDYYQESVKTDNGPQPLTRCRWCLRTKEEIENRERKPVLGLDFGNTIKPIGQDGLMYGLDKALPKLKELFGNEIYVVSRVNDLVTGEAHVREFMQKNDLFQYIPEQNLNFCLLRSEKAPICERLKITHFVDDRTECLSHMNTVPFRYAINPTAKQIADFPPSGMKVSTDWYGVIARIDEDVG
jgi:hypothetical protein